MKNYIEKLHVKDFRLFKEVNVKFNKKFNFIVGPNGCGKTSLLRALILSYSTSDLDDSRYDENFEVWTDIYINNIKNRIGVKHRKDKSIKNGYRVRPDLSHELPVKSDEIDKIMYSFKAIKESRYTPLVLGAYRRIEYKKIAGMKGEEEEVKARENYSNQSTKSLNGGILPNVKQWMINRYFEIEKEWAVIEKENWDWLLKNIKNIAPKNLEFDFLRIERNLEPIFSLKNKECYLEELSAGFQSILSIIFAIFEWIETTNSEENMLVKNAVGTVIIDELDVHLHPEWQLVIKDVLCNLFPKLQFIATTHSPHMVASAEAGEVIIMSKDSEKVNLKPSSKSYSGWSTDNILEDIMGVTNLENKKYNFLINTAFNHIQNNDYIELEKIINKLEKISHSNDTIVTTLRIKLASLMLGDVNDQID